MIHEQRERRPRRFRRRAAALLIGCTVSFALAEIVLRIHNPLAAPARAADIELPVFKAMARTLEPDPRICTDWRVRHNSLGFRGPEPPGDLAAHDTLLTIGGSTTACFALSDGYTWPDELRRLLSGPLPDLWINNAGFIGHSTFGHLVLLEKYVAVLRPRHVLFLIGLNDMGRDDLTSWDEELRARDSLKNRLLGASEVLSSLLTIRRYCRAVDQGVAQAGTLDFAALPPADRPERPVAALRAAHADFLAAFRSRVVALVRTCRDHGIRPILMTQPAMYGDGADPATGIDIGSRAFQDGGPAREQWRILELYNDVTRSVAAERGVHLIDLASLMPKDSTYYFDWWHFSIAGAREVARLVADHLVPMLAR